MDILSYLAEVIQTHREVGVPELGTFFKKKLPGRYDVELRSFLPPAYQLEYTTEVTEDVLLAKYISQRHHISIESAVYHIDQFVANLKEKLGEDKEVSLDELGRFVLIDGELTYEGNPKLNLGLKYYGLPATAEEIVKPDSPVEPKEEIAVASVPETPLAEEADQLEAINLENNLEEENPGNLPTEPIYLQEPEELVEATEEPVEETLAPVKVVATSEAVIPPVVVPTEIIETPVVEENIGVQAPMPTENVAVESPVVVPSEVIENPVVATSEAAPPPVVAVNTAEQAPVTPVSPAAENLVQQPATPVQATVPPLNEPVVPPVNYQLETVQKSETPAYMKVLIAILALLTIGMALFLWNPGIFKQSKSLQDTLETSPVPSAIPTTPLATDSLAAQDTLKKDTLTQPIVPADAVSKDTVVKAAPAATPVVSGPVTYEVIGSSVYSEKEAANFIASMKRKWGLDAKIVSQRPGKKIKISIASYKDEKTARAERARLEEKINIPGLYIYINTHKPE